MNTKTLPDKPSELITKAIAEATQATKRQLIDWAPESERQRSCEKHGIKTPVDWDLSTHATTKAGENRLVFTPCPACVKEGEIAKRSAWLAQCGVPDNMLQCGKRSGVGAQVCGEAAYFND